MHPHRFTGWQKLVSFVAIILALLIVLNPEFLALGLFGDAAFFDLLVLALSLQLQMVATRLWHTVGPIISITLRVIIPRNTMSSEYVMLAVAQLAEILSAIRKGGSQFLAKSV